MRKHEPRLEVTIKVAVNEKWDKTNPEDELWLRSLVTEFKQLATLAGRGKFEFDVKYDRPTKCRSSKRALNKKEK